MIPFSIIINLERFPVEIIYKNLQRYSEKELELTRQELNDFRDSKNKLRYPTIYQALLDILNNQVPEIIRI